MSSLTVADLIAERRYHAAVARMQGLCAIADPEVPVDADEVRAQYEATRARLREAVPPAPFRMTVQYVNGGQR